MIGGGCGRRERWRTHRDMERSAPFVDAVTRLLRGKEGGSLMYRYVPAQYTGTIQGTGTIGDWVNLESYYREFGPSCFTGTI